MLRVNVVFENRWPTLWYFKTSRNETAHKRYMTQKGAQVTEDYFIHIMGADNLKTGLINFGFESAANQQKSALVRYFHQLLIFAST